MAVIGVDTISTQQTYKSKYGSSGLKKRNETTAADSTENKDSFASTHKKKKNYSVLGTIALIAATAFATYKGKDAIGGFIKNAKSTIGKKVAGAKLATKWPNLTQAVKSFGEACKTPAKPFIKAGKFITGLFTKKTT